jgi:ankyrin repeat protein
MLPSPWSNTQSAARSTKSKKLLTGKLGKEKGGKDATARRNDGGGGDHDDDFDDGDDFRGDLTAEERDFLRAVSHRNYPAVGKCLKQGVDVHVQNFFKRDAMQIAARNCDRKMLELLHHFGGRVNSRGPKGDSLVHLAAYNGGVKAIRWLVEFGAVPFSVDMHGQHAGHYAARRCNLECVVFLLEDLKLDFKEEDFDGMTPYALLPRVASNEETVKMRKYFDEQGIFK